jgi:hypothetical protein
MDPATTELEALRVIARLLDAVHQVQPCDLSGLIAEAGGRLGATATRMWLVDHGQRLLVNLTTSGPPLTPLSIDGSLAGRAFAARTVVTSDRSSSLTCIWYPLIDGVDRVGVLEVEHPQFTPVLADAFRHLASIAAAELVTRGQYTDIFTVVRRRQPMTLAAELQWQSLPPRSFATPDISVAAMLEPAYDTGGDAFDYAHDGHTLHFAVLDAVGHDLGASAISTLALGAYRNQRRSGSSLLQIAPVIDHVLAEQVGAGAFATGILAELDTRDGTLRWLNGGHPPPFLVRDRRQIRELTSAPRVPFGLGHRGGRPATVTTTRLQPGDAVLLYTDGIVEARDSSGESFGQPRLVDFLAHSFAGALSPAETVRRLSHAVLDHHGGHLQDDATTLLVVWHPN